MVLPYEFKGQVTFKEGVYACIAGKDNSNYNNNFFHELRIRLSDDQRYNFMVILPN